MPLNTSQFIWPLFPKYILLRYFQWQFLNLTDLQKVANFSQIKYT